MDFAILPPEINSARMYAGAGAEPMLAAATAWQALATELHAAGTGYESTIAELGNAWSGPSATRMATAASPYATWMHTTAVQAEQTAAQAKAAAVAYDAAFAMTVPPPTIAANRSQLMRLLATNVLGQNTAAIAAAEAQYTEMWAQDVAAMYDYAGNAATASILKPFAPPPPTTNPTGSANQAVAAGQSAATAVGSHAQSAIAQLAAVPNALQGLTSPAAAGSAVATGPATALGGLLPPLAADPTLGLAYLGLASSLFGTFVIDSAGTFGVDVAGSFGIDLIGVGEIDEALELPFAELGWSSPVTAGAGEAATVGRLSVPQAWTATAPSLVQHVSTAVAPTSAATGSAIAAMPFAEMATAGLAGRAVAAAGRGRRAATATQQQPDAAQQPAPDSPITAIAVELRELAQLRDAGILTEEEFTEQKRRLLDP
ncbi:MAG TPA: PPE domain-containing protein [Mycobacterium sp.]|nr:PPE domain-containing protein [Mycobacterium sp.]